MRDSVRAIRSCVLYPDHSCLHLRQLAENMAEQEVSRAPTMDSHSQQQELETAAETVARFIYLLWGSAGPDEYGPRTYEMLMNLQNRMRGMWTEGTWEYALAAFGCDIRSRLKQAENITIAPETATALREQFFDSLGNHEYLHEVVREIMDLPWKQRRGLGAIPPDQIGGSKDASIPRGDPKMERRLKWLASEALAMYIEQANIARGNIEHPTDPMIVLRDRIGIQVAWGAETHALGRSLDRESQISSNAVLARLWPAKKPSPRGPDGSPSRNTGSTTGQSIRQHDKPDETGNTTTTPRQARQFRRTQRPDRAADRPSGRHWRDLREKGLMHLITRSDRRLAISALLRRRCLY